MKKLGRAVAFALFLIAVSAVATGCCSSGSREYVPGKGWIKN